MEAMTGRGATDFLTAPPVTPASTDVVGVARPPALACRWVRDGRQGGRLVARWVAEHDPDRPCAQIAGIPPIGQHDLRVNRSPTQPTHSMQACSL